MIYVIKMGFGVRNRFLLWDDDPIDNKYYLGGDGSVYSFESDIEARRFAAKFDISLSDNHAYTISLRIVFCILVFSHSDFEFNKQDCHVILMAWDALEDLARSCGCRLGKLVGSKNVLNKMRDMVFYGNNLPSVTPRGGKYSPVFSWSEIRLLRRYLKYLMGKVRFEEIGGN